MKRKNEFEIVIDNDWTSIGYSNTYVHYYDSKINNNKQLCDKWILLKYVYIYIYIYIIYLSLVLEKYQRRKLLLRSPLSPGNFTNDATTDIFYSQLSIHSRCRIWFQCRQIFTSIFIIYLLPKHSLIFWIYNGCHMCVGTGDEAAAVTDITAATVTVWLVLLFLVVVFLRLVQLFLFLLLSH